MQFGCARITSAICGSVNLILAVGFIGRTGGPRFVVGLHASWSLCAPCGICHRLPSFCSSLPRCERCRRRFDLSPSSERLIAQRPPLRMPPCAQLPSRERQWAWGGRAASGPPTSVVEPGGVAGRRGRAQGLAPGVVVPNAAVAIRRGPCRRSYPASHRTESAARRVPDRSRGR